MLNRVSQFFWKTLRTSTHRLVLDWLLILIGSMTLGGGLVYAYTLYSRGEPSRPPTHAALFMQSVVTRDGELGWHQLCPDVQAVLPQMVLIREANTQRAADLRQGVTLSMQPLATHSLAKGDKLYLYLVTAHKPDGWEAQRMYMVRTRSSGCVKDVKYQDL
jgi:hypothetical protein